MQNNNQQQNNNFPPRNNQNRQQNWQGAPQQPIMGGGQPHQLHHAGQGGYQPQPAQMQGQQPWQQQHQQTQGQYQPQGQYNQGHQQQWGGGQQHQHQNIQGGAGGGYQGRRPYNNNQGGGQGGAPPRGRGRGGAAFGSSPFKPAHAGNSNGPISLITNNFKIKSQSNHSGIIYTYSVDFIDGENVDTIQQMPMPVSQHIAQQAEAAHVVPNPEEESKRNLGYEESKLMIATQIVNPKSGPNSVVRNFNVNNLETFQKYKILGAPAQAAKLKSIFVNYVCVGDNIFSTTAVDEQIDFETKQFFFGRKFTILIQRVSEFALDELNSMRMEDHPFALNFINSIIKTQMRNSNLCQIGRNPRFFMRSEAKVFDNAVQTWPGFFTSSWIFQRGLYLIIDNISKNLSVDNCLQLINEQMERFRQKRFRYSNHAPKVQEFQKAVIDEFKGAIVMACYGHHKTYKVSNVRFDMCPETCNFEQGEAGTTISMAAYFKQQYDKQILEMNQPLFEIKQKRQNIYLPPEFTMLVGIPQKVRENKKTVAQMRQSLFQKPHDRIHSIQQLNKMIAQSEEVKQWGLDISLTPDTIEAKVLEKPQIFETPNFQQQTARGNNYYQQNQQQTPPTPTRATAGDAPVSRVLDNSNCLNSMVHEPKNFERFAIICLEKDVQNAHYINDKFYNLSIQKGLDIRVEYADICPVPDKAAVHEEYLLEAFASSIQNYYNKKVLPTIQQSNGAIKHSNFIFLVIMPDHTNHQDFYSFLKNKINCDSPVISQFVANRTIAKDNDRIFLNIIRQMNAKFGGDLWRMSFGSEISQQTMLVGIDVCHKGKQSTIGFCATYDPNMCKYYAQASSQPVKGQEIISSTILSDYFQRSFAAYREFNNAMPRHIFIYRDGVGDSMRKQVIEMELEQLNRIVAMEYAGYGDEPPQEHPEITLIIVNKRVRQRFFQQTPGNNGQNFIDNPPQGTYVDTGFVEQSEVIDGKFDFFLVPHSVTQGSVKPTHFYVAKNSSHISKMAILNFTYALCYNYYNWNDAIKIPAPCMLADKIAGFRSEVGTIPSNVDLHKLPFYL